MPDCHNTFFTFPGREFAASALPFFVYFTTTGVGFFARQLGISIIVVFEIKLVILFGPAFIRSIAGGFGVRIFPIVISENTQVKLAEIENCSVRSRSVRLPTIFKLAPLNMIAVGAISPFTSLK